MSNHGEPAFYLRERLVRYRKKARRKIWEIANDCDLSYKTVQRFLSDSANSVSAATRGKISRFLYDQGA